MNCFSELADRVVNTIVFTTAVLMFLLFLSAIFEFVYYRFNLAS